jgi:curli biogenesis system outer membrane secretion channel CsgG
LLKDIEMLKNKILVSLFTASTLLLAGCPAATAPKLGGGQGSGTVTGSAGGASKDNANSQLESCPEPLGTVSVFEDRSLPWWNYYASNYRQLGSTIPVIRLMVQQSGCFVVVERGAAMKAVSQERQLMNSGETRSGSNFGKGQIVAADYTLSPSVQFSKKGTGGLGALAGGLLGSAGAIIGGSLKKNEAATTLLLIDNRSAVQISASTGSAKNYDLGIGFGRAGSGFVGLGAYTDSPQGKVVVAAFADSFNQMVKSLRTYKAQQVKGGLGKGGQLKVGN